MLNSPGFLKRAPDALMSPKKSVPTTGSALPVRDPGNTGLKFTGLLMFYNNGLQLIRLPR